jgi:hypothetical protein
MISITTACADCCASPLNSGLDTEHHACRLHAIWLLAAGCWLRHSIVQTDKPASIRCPGPVAFGRRGYPGKEGSVGRTSNAITHSGIFQKIPRIRVDAFGITLLAPPYPLTTDEGLVVVVLCTLHLFLRLSPSFSIPGKSPAPPADLCKRSRHVFRCVYICFTPFCSVY